MKNNLTEKGRAVRKTRAVARGLYPEDTPAILGIDPVRTPFAVWSEKTGHELQILDNPDPTVDGWPTFQKYLLDVYRTHALRVVHRVPRRKMANPAAACEFVRADVALLQTPQAGHKGPGGILLARSVPFMGACPPTLYAQAQHVMYAMGEHYEWCTVVGLAGAGLVRWFDVERAPAFLEMCERRWEAFWERVENEEPPEADGRPETREVIARMFPKEEYRKIVALPEWVVPLDGRRQRIIEQLLELGKEREAIENKIRMALGPNQTGVLPSGATYAWKTVEKAAHQQPATSYRRLVRQAP